MNKFLPIYQSESGDEQLLTHKDIMNIEAYEREKMLGGYDESKPIK